MMKPTAALSEIPCQMCTYVQLPIHVLDKYLWSKLKVMVNLDKKSII